MSMRVDIIDGCITGENMKTRRGRRATTLRMAGSDLDRSWTSRGNLIVMYWQKELWHGSMSEIKKTFAEVERAAEKDYAELKDSLGRSSRPGDARAYVNGKTGKLTVGVSVSFGKDEAGENWHTLLFDWTH